MRDQEARLTRRIDSAATRYRELVEIQSNTTDVAAVRAAWREAEAVMLDFRRALAELTALRERREPVEMLVIDSAAA